jgi:uncharacterized protein with HEPN domain
MTDHDDQVYLSHILQCIVSVGAFSRGMIDTLSEDPKSWHATIRVLQIMAESCVRLSDKAKAAMPEIEWHRLRGFRNVLVHDYLGDIDPQTIQHV